MDSDPHGLFVLTRDVDLADLDGAVAELHVHGDTITAEIRIPGPPVP